MQENRDESEVWLNRQVDVAGQQTERLWISLGVPDGMYGDLYRVVVGNRRLVVLEADGSLATRAGGEGKRAGFRVAPNLPEAGSLYFRAVDCQVYNAGPGSSVRLAVHVSDMKKGDKFQCFSSMYPGGWSSVKLEAYDPDGRLQTIHEVTGVASQEHSCWLDWPWP